MWSCGCGHVAVVWSCGLCVVVISSCVVSRWLVVVSFVVVVSSFVKQVCGSIVVVVDRC
jgi:hypothetical protein